MVAAVHGVVCPLVVMVYVPGTMLVGIPLMVTVLFVVFTTAVKPDGKFVTIALVALPPNVYTVCIIEAPAQTVWSCVPLVKLIVEAVFTVIAPLIVAAIHGAVWPLVVIVYVPVAVGVPLIVTVLLVVFTTAVKPDGKFVTVALVALPPNVYTVVAIGVPEQTVWF